MYMEHNHPQYEIDHPIPPRESRTGYMMTQAKRIATGHLDYRDGLSFVSIWDGVYKRMHDTQESWEDAEVVRWGHGPNCRMSSYFADQRSWDTAVHRHEQKYHPNGAPI